LSKISFTAAVTAIALMTAPVAFAQALNPTGDRIKSDEIRASNMIGSSVYDRQNQDLGKVKDIVLNKDGRIDAVVVDVGTFLGMGGKYVAVRPTDIKTDNNRLTLDMDKGQLKQALAYHLENRDTGAGTSTSPVEGGHLGTPAQRRE
jgi:sporulation protein YlmC with PRC-barrel domain